MDKNLTFEEIDAHLDKHQPKISTAKSLKAAPTASQLCDIYRSIRPILSAIANMPFIPKKWRDAIATFMSVLDMMCPS